MNANFLKKLLKTGNMYYIMFLDGGVTAGTYQGVAYTFGSDAVVQFDDSEGTTRYIDCGAIAMVSGR